MTMAGEQEPGAGEIRVASAPPPVGASPSAAAGSQAPPTGQQPVVTVAGRRYLPRAGTWSIFALVVAALVSFLAVGQQLGGPDKFRQQLDAESEGDLTRILASLSTEATNLQDELSALKVELATLQSSSEVSGAAAAASTAQLNALQVLSGTVPVEGPGIELSIADPHGAVGYDSLVDAVQELRDAGAEALSCNGHRIGATSSFTQANGVVSLDGEELHGPYVLSAIGPAPTMEGGLKIPGGSIDSLRAISGVTVDVRRSTSLQLPALSRLPTFRSATPVGSSS